MRSQRGCTAFFVAFARVTGDDADLINHKVIAMALLPSFENILIEVHQSLGFPYDASKKKFAAQGMELEGHLKMTGEMLHAIFKSLDMDEQACRDAMTNCLEWANFQKNLELNTWTGNASEQQVLWHVLTYAYVPALARRLAFWDLAGQQRGMAFDAGMPGGEFWFLPLWDRVGGTLTLPVPQVIDWLLDLLGTSSLQELDKALGKKEVRENPDSNLARTLQNWHQGTLPKSAQKIEELFPGSEDEETALNFEGAFVSDESLTLEAQFQTALAKVSLKGLTAQTLRHQIPMSAERLEPVFNGNAPEDEKQEFVRLIALRYAKPSMPAIRQRLRIARMAQDGYQRLLKNLCGEGVKETCADPAQNKLLQLIPLFQSIYNLTIQAYQSAGTVEEEDAWFEAHLAPWDKADLLLSIVPSRKETAYLELSQKLTRKFMALNADSPLQDLVPLGEPGEPNEMGVMGADAKAVIERRCLSLQQELEEDLRLIELIEKVRRASPWRALEAEPSYWVLSQFAHEKTVSPNARAMAIKRMRELATTPGQAIGPLLLELGFLLNGEPKQRPKDSQQRVQRLLEEAEANTQGYQEWKAPLLRLRAKHRLMQNDFKGAAKDFKDALAACAERSFGAVRGEIARDGFAAQMAIEGFIPNNHEAYYRSMLWFDMFPDGRVSFEDAAIWCEDFFWTDLYHPYPGFERKQRQMTPQFTAAFDETLDLIFKADWDGLQHWLKRHRSKLQKASIPDARRDSLLILWMKMQSEFQKKLPALQMMTPANMAGEYAKVGQLIDNWHQAIELLIHAWPEQAKIADFKGQTPLMLAADNGNAPLTRLLAPLSDVNAQDHIGRTALHSAVTGRSPECVAIVLDCNPEVVKVTKDEQNTALHTAVRFGQPECVRLILEEFPSLALQANLAGDTPLAMAKDLLKDLPGWQAHMRRQNRRTGEAADFEAIIVQLETSAL